MRYQWRTKAQMRLLYIKQACMDLEFLTSKKSLSESMQVRLYHTFNQLSSFMTQAAGRRKNRKIKYAAFVEAV